MGFFHFKGFLTICICYPNKHTKEFELPNWDSRCESGQQGRIRTVAVGMEVEVKIKILGANFLLNLVNF